jgi:hypothetical protein
LQDEQDFQSRQSRNPAKRQFGEANQGSDKLPFWAIFAEFVWNGVSTTPACGHPSFARRGITEPVVLAFGGFRSDAQRTDLRAKNVLGRNRPKRRSVTGIKPPVMEKCL